MLSSFKAKEKWKVTLNFKPKKMKNLHVLIITPQQNLDSIYFLQRVRKYFWLFQSHLQRVSGEMN